MGSGIIRYTGASKTFSKFRSLTIIHIRPNSDLRKRTLEFAMSEKVRSNDTPFVMASCASSGSDGRKETWEFVKKNYNTFLERYKLLHTKLDI